MESATLNRPEPDTDPRLRPADAAEEPPGGLLRQLRARSADAWARIAFAALCIAGTIGFFLYPTYPNYDSIYSLIWGRELLALDPLSLDAYRAPTEHPLAIFVGALLSPLGRGAERVVVALTLISYLALVWGVYKLARKEFTAFIGAIAAVLVLTRFDFAFLAVRGYIDIPYLALVIWAAVVEAQRPAQEPRATGRRAVIVLVLLALAGMMRPEAWALAGLYWLWAAWRASWRARIGLAALAALGPLVWIGVDALATGDPLYSLHYTSGSAEALGRQRTLSEIPAALPEFFRAIVKLPVAIAGFAGLLLALWLVPKRIGVLLILFLSGIGTFVLVGIAGLSVIERYLVVAALALLIFAAFALGGWSMLVRGSRLRLVWGLLAGALVVYGLVYTGTRLSLEQFDNELAFRGASRAALVKLLDDPAVRAGMRCGPVSVPNHKLIPDVRWLLDLDADRVIARSDPSVQPRTRRGVAIYVSGRPALFTQAFSNPDDSALIEVPQRGFRRVAVSGYYGAYVSCR